MLIINVVHWSLKTWGIFPNVLLCLIQFYVLGVESKEGTIPHWWDLFVFGILTFLNLSSYICFSMRLSLHPSNNLMCLSATSQAVYQEPGGVCERAKTSWDTTKGQFLRKKKKGFRPFLENCPSRATVVCHWPDTNPLPSFYNPQGPKTFVCLRGQFTDVALGHPPLYLYCT